MEGDQEKETESDSVPDSHEYLMRGHIFEREGKNIDALECYSLAISLDHEFSTAYYHRGALYAKMGRNKDALEDFTKTIKHDLEYADAYSSRAEIYEKMGMKSEAEADRKKAKTFDGSSKD